MVIIFGTIIFTYLITLTNEMLKRGKARIKHAAQVPTYHNTALE